MKKNILLMIPAVLFLFISGALADEGMKSHDMASMGGGSPGKMIRETVVEGYRFSYELIDLRAQMKGMKGMAGMNTHHLMVSIKDPEGKSVASAQVGYLIVGPGGAEQKAMTMSMGEGYGADINLSKPGEYAIKCKVAFGDKKLLDDFTYKAD